MPEKIPNGYLPPAKEEEVTPWLGMMDSFIESAKQSRPDYPWLTKESVDYLRQEINASEMLDVRDKERLLLELEELKQY